MSEKKPNPHIWAKVMIAVAIIAFLGTVISAVIAKIPAPTLSASTTLPQEFVAVDPSAKYSIRVYNCDDVCQVFIGDATAPTIEVKHSEDSGWVDITRFINTQEVEFKFRVLNTGGSITYGFQIRKGDSPDPIRDIKCGVVGSIGCENNKTYPYGLAMERSYKFVHP